MRVKTLVKRLTDMLKQQYVSVDMMEQVLLLWLQTMTEITLSG